MIRGRRSSPDAWPALRWGWALAVALAVLLPAVSSADEWSARPRVSLRLVYDDNPRLWRNHTNDALGVITEAAVDLGWSDGVSQLSFTPRLRYNEYGSDHPELDSLDQYYTLSGVTRTERAKFGVTASASFATVLSTEDVVEETGGRDRRDRKVDRDSLTISPSFSYVLSERNTLGVDFSASDVDYQGRGYHDYQFYTANLSLGHALSERDTVSAIIYLSRYDRTMLESGTILRIPFWGGLLAVPVRGDVDATTDSIGVQAGYERSLTETLKGRVAAGVVRSELSADKARLAGGLGSVELVEDNTDWGQLINLSLSEKLERMTWDFAASRSLSPTSDGVLVRRDEVSGGLTRELAPRASGRLRLMGFREEGLKSSGDYSDRKYARLEAGISYRLTPFWTLSGWYQFRREKYEYADAAATSNAFWITIGYQGDKWAVSR